MLCARVVGANDDRKIKHGVALFGQFTRLGPFTRKPPDTKVRRVGTTKAEGNGCIHQLFAGYHHSTSGVIAVRGYEKALVGRSYIISRSRRLYQIL